MGGGGAPRPGVRHDHGNPVPVDRRRAALDGHLAGRRPRALRLAGSAEPEGDLPVHRHLRPGGGELRLGEEAAGGRRDPQVRGRRRHLETGEHGARQPVRRVALHAPGEAGRAARRGGQQYLDGRERGLPHRRRGRALEARPEVRRGHHLGRVLDERSPHRLRRGIKPLLRERRRRQHVDRAPALHEPLGPAEHQLGVPDRLPGRPAQPPAPLHERLRRGRLRHDGRRQDVDAVVHGVHGRRHPGPRRAARQPGRGLRERQERPVPERGRRRALGRHQCRDHRGHRGGIADRDRPDGTVPAADDGVERRPGVLERRRRSHLAELHQRLAGPRPPATRRRTAGTTRASKRWPSRRPDPHGCTRPSATTRAR